MSTPIYKTITQFGSNKYQPIDNPLTYCMGIHDINQRFFHGSSASRIVGQQTRPCQKFLSEYCAKNWDGFCEKASQNQNISFPNAIANCNSGYFGVNMTAGDILLRNTAAQKYLVAMYNCEERQVLFDPNVPTSPKLTYWVPMTNCGGAPCGGACVPVYYTDPATVDADPLMDHVLARPDLFTDILVNMYNTAKRNDALQKFDGTKLGAYFKKTYT